MCDGEGGGSKGKTGKKEEMGEISPVTLLVFTQIT
jgi:hypothetical protein